MARWSSTVRANSRQLAVESPWGLAVSMTQRYGEAAGQQGLRPDTLKSGQVKRVLLFHMGGVLGHLHRVLALAEEIDSAGHEAIVATSDGGLPILRALKPGVRLAEAYDDPGLKVARATLASTTAGRGGDRRNLRSMGPQNVQDRAVLAQQMERMAVADRALVERIEPDAIVVDHRFTAWPVLRDLRDRTFYVSPLLGLPSLYQRATGQLPYPLEEARILVPGIRQIECWRRQLPSPGQPGRIVLCGPFRWRGWRRLRGTKAVLPPVEALFYFGSTGEAGRIGPLLRKAARHGFSSRWVGEAPCGSAEGEEPAVDLESGLASAELLFCHGGHGTVMEALLKGRPVIVIPSNPEQLEIGLRLEKMRLGLVVRQRAETLTQADLAGLVARVREDARMRRRLEEYSALLRPKAEGARVAAQVVLGHLGVGLSGMEAAKEG